MNPVFITTDSGDELAILPRKEFERLAALANEAEEDAGTVRILERSRAERDAGREVLFPMQVAERLANGENPIRVLREWRGLTQAQLALQAGLSQSYVADLEKGRRAGTAPTLNSLSSALKVPIDVLAVPFSAG